MEGIEQRWPVAMLAAVPASPVTHLDKGLHLAKPQFPHIQNGGDNGTKV